MEGTSDELTFEETFPDFFERDFFSISKISLPKICFPFFVFGRVHYKNKLQSSIISLHAVTNSLGVQNFELISFDSILIFGY